MANEEKPIKHDGGPSSETLEPKLSEAQRQTILKYAQLPAHLSDRFEAKGANAKDERFTLDELDELLDYVEDSVYRAKGNERQKVQRIAERLSKLLGSTIDPNDLPKNRDRKKTDAVFQIKITLRGIDPLIWRRIQTQDCPLDRLHALIQIAMGWEFDHLYRFDIGGVEYTDRETDDDDEVKDVCKTMLSDVLPEQNRRPRFEYEYDFGDGWIHQLIVEDRFAPEEGTIYPVCVAGERACPPEDSGGPSGYWYKLEAIRDPNHERYEEVLEWLGDEFDPERFDLKAVNDEFRPKRTGKS